MDAYSVQRGGRLLGESLVVLLFPFAMRGIGVPLCKHSNQVDLILICVIAHTSRRDFAYFADRCKTAFNSRFPTFLVLYLNGSALVCSIIALSLTVRGSQFIVRVKKERSKVPRASIQTSIDMSSFKSSRNHIG